MTHAALADARMPKRQMSMMAACLILTALIEVLAIFHHPHVQDRDQLHATLEIVSLSHLSGWIHGIAIGCCLLIAYFLGELLGKQIPAPVMRLAALVYAAGITTWITAATVDGWVLGRLAGSLPHDTVADLESNARIFKMCMACVVASTNLGFVLSSVGIFVASVGLLRKGLPWQIAGTLGLLVGAALSFSILAGRLTMDGHGALVAVGLQGLWFVSLGIVSLKTTWGS
jgi:hypothetical protein